MKVVVDSSVLFAAMMRDARVRRVLLSPGIHWIAPGHARGEVQSHRAKISKFTGLGRTSASQLLSIVLRDVDEVSITPHDPEFAVATALIGPRDPSDVPFVAVALKYDALGIWALDRDFDGVPPVPRFTTAGVAKLLDLVGPQAGSGATG